MSQINNIPTNHVLIFTYIRKKLIFVDERGPAFDLLVKKLEKDGGQDFTPQFKELSNKYATAYT